jgi:beta-lactam-binding protein with PASTA domain
VAFTEQAFAGDYVADQSPSGNRLANPRSEVTLTPGVPVPRGMIGQTEASANARLQGVGLVGARGLTVQRETENSFQGGQRRVASHFPPAGTLLRRGSSVRLNVEQYVYVPRVSVPNVVGMAAYIDAVAPSPVENKLRNAGFSWQYHEVRPPRRGMWGIVARQFPAGGTRVPANRKPVIQVYVYDDDAPNTGFPNNNTQTDPGTQILQGILEGLMNNQQNQGHDQHRNRNRIGR